MPRSTTGVIGAAMLVLILLGGFVPSTDCASAAAVSKYINKANKASLLSMLASNPNVQLPEVLNERLSSGKKIRIKDLLSLDSNTFANLAAALGLDSALINSGGGGGVLAGLLGGGDLANQANSIAGSLFGGKLFPTTTARTTTRPTTSTTTTPAPTFSPTERPADEYDLDGEGPDNIGDEDVAEGEGSDPPETTVTDKTTTTTLAAATDPPNNNGEGISTLDPFADFGDDLWDEEW